MVIKRLTFKVFQWLFGISEQLKHKSERIGISISKLIRTAVEKDLNQSSNNDAKTFFDTLKPLEIFASTESEKYVDDIRSHRRIFNS